MNALTWAVVCVLVLTATAFAVLLAKRNWKRMRILLDSRDLINLVERERPITPARYAAFLRNGNHLNVLSFTNVRELCGGIAAGVDFMQIRPMLQTLEGMPHTYMKEVSIIGLEIQAAVTAFENGTEYQAPDPYTDRWDRVLRLLPGQRQGGTDDWINLRLDEVVYLIRRANRGVFAPPEQHLPRLRRQLEEDRNLLRTGQAPARLHFIRAMPRHAATHGVQLPNGREEEFARWVYRNPNRCPGLRLHHETYRALMGNYGDIPEASDFSDLAHVYALPYVDAATLDRRMRHYCTVASVTLMRLGCASDYAARIHRDLDALITTINQ